jgi:galactose mutarotase-like enzyme
MFQQTIQNLLIASLLLVSIISKGQVTKSLNLLKNSDFEKVIDSKKVNLYTPKNSLGTVAQITNYAAKVVEPLAGRIMEVYTNEPGIQFYGGNFLDRSVKGKDGKYYEHRPAFCLETQHFPDNPNEQHFPSTVLNPGKEYYSVCVYKSSVTD